MGGGILTSNTFSATLDEVRSRKRLLWMRGRFSTDNTNQTMARQINRFYQFRKDNDLADPHGDHYYLDEGISGTRRGRNGREEWHRLVRDLRKTRRKVLIWVAEMDRFRDFAEFVAFWDEFLRDNDRVALYIDAENKIINCHTSVNDQAFAMVMAWQAEQSALAQRKKTSDGVRNSEHYKNGKWGPARKPVDDKIRQLLVDPAYEHSNGKPNISKIAEACDVSRDTVRRRIQDMAE